MSHTTITATLMPTATTAPISTKRRPSSCLFRLHRDHGCIRVPDHPIDRSEKAKDKDIPGEESRWLGQAIFVSQKQQQIDQTDEQARMCQHEADGPRVLCRAGRLGLGLLGFG